MDIETMPHAMYFTGDRDTVTKINHVPYQTIVYNDNSMFTAKLINDTPSKYSLAMEPHLPFYPYRVTINSPFYIRIPEQKAILLYIQEKV